MLSPLCYHHYILFIALSLRLIIRFRALPPCLLYVSSYNSLLQLLLYVGML